MAAAMRHPMRFLKLRGFPIFQQLQIEERLLRATTENWCIVNDGTSPPSIVMGVSGKAEELVDVEAVSRDGIPVVRRFSGGGTVIVDENTLFVTLICSREALPHVELFPKPLMKWSGEFYDNVFRLPGFRLREQDYAIGERKFGGNAESIIKDRWLHHTSFLWDYSRERMGYLKMPSRVPAYRLGRSHADFVCKLKDFLPSRESFVQHLETGLENYFSLHQCRLEDIGETSKEYSTKIVPLNYAQAT